MAGGVLVAMLFVAMLFAGHAVLPIMLLIVILAAAGWWLAERRARQAPGPEPPGNGPRPPAVAPRGRPQPPQLGALAPSGEGHVGTPRSLLQALPLGSVTRHHQRDPGETAGVDRQIDTLLRRQPCRHQRRPVGDGIRRARERADGM